MEAQGHETWYSNMDCVIKTKADCGNWYVLSTMFGNEVKIKTEIGELLKNRYDLFIPCREMFHKFRGGYRKVVRPLFPGYIFICEKIESLLVEIRNTHLQGRLHPVRFDSKYAMVCEREMMFLMEMTGPTGLVKASRAILNRDRTLIFTSGPLRYLSSEIIYYDIRKKKAKIKISFLNRDVKVTLGLEIMNPV